MKKLKRIYLRTLSLIRRLKPYQIIRCTEQPMSKNRRGFCELTHQHKLEF